MSLTTSAARANGSDKGDGDAVQELKSLADFLVVIYRNCLPLNYCYRKIALMSDYIKRVSIFSMKMHCEVIDISRRKSTAPQLRMRRHS